MASIRKRTWKSGGEDKAAWIADYFDQAGKRHIKTFSTKKAADAWLVSTRSKVAHGIHTPENASITVAEAAELWYERGQLENLERSTLRSYRAHIDLHINPRDGSGIGGIKLAQLSTPGLEAFRDVLLKRCSRAMARKILGSLKAILNDAQRRGLVARNAAMPVKVDLKKRDKRKLTVGREIPSKEEVQTILATAKGRWRPFLVTAVFTGMRSSELRGLTWDDVNFDRQVVHVRQRADHWGAIGAPKSAAGDREIPLPPLAANTLREWKLQCPRLKAEPAPRLWLVFPNGNGRVENHANFANRGFYTTQRAAGIVDAKGKPKYGLHALRHFYASWLIEQRCYTEKELQSMLGHSSIRMTFDTYGHLFPPREDNSAKLAAAERALVG